MNKPTVFSPVYKSRKQIKEKKQYEKLPVPTTSNLDGHPDIIFNHGISAGEIYPVTDKTYGNESTGTKHLSLLVFKYYQPANRGIDDWDWNEVKYKGGYTINELKEKILREGLIPPPNARKTNLVDFLLENKKKIL